MKKFFVLIFGFLTYISPAFAETIRISIGTQDTTINCAVGGLLVRELGLLEKYLPRDGKYKDVVYDVEWSNYTSGPPLTAGMVAGKIDIGNMGEFPAFKNIVAFGALGKKSIVIAALSESHTGGGNGIVVPASSSVTSVKDLKGKTISVPIGSSAHGMLLRALEENGLTVDDVTIINQSPEIAGTALKVGRVDAHADFVPFAELFPFRGFARKIYDGSQSKIPTFHAALADESFAKKYPELVVAYLRAAIEANALISENPEKYSKLIAEKTGIDYPVVRMYYGKDQIQERNLAISKEDRFALANAQDTLRKLGLYTAQVIDIDSVIDDSFIKKALALSHVKK